LMQFSPASYDKEKTKIDLSRMKNVLLIDLDNIQKPLNYPDETKQKDFFDFFGGPGSIIRTYVEHYCHQMGFANAGQSELFFSLLATGFCRAPDQEESRILTLKKNIDDSILVTEEFKLPTELLIFEHITTSLKSSENIATCRLTTKISAVNNSIFYEIQSFEIIPGSSKESKAICNIIFDKSELKHFQQYIVGTDSYQVRQQALQQITQVSSPMPFRQQTVRAAAIPTTPPLQQLMTAAALPPYAYANTLQNELVFEELQTTTKRFNPFNIQQKGWEQTKKDLPRAEFIAFSSSNGIAKQTPTTSWSNDYKFGDLIRHYVGLPRPDKTQIFQYPSLENLQKQIELFFTNHPIKQYVIDMANQNGFGLAAETIITNSLGQGTSLACALKIGNAHTMLEFRQEVDCSILVFNTYCFPYEVNLLNGKYTTVISSPESIATSTLITRIRERDGIITHDIEAFDIIPGQQQKSQEILNLLYEKEPNFAALKPYIVGTKEYKDRQQALQQRQLEDDWEVIFTTPSSTSTPSTSSNGASTSQTKPALTTIPNTSTTEQIASLDITPPTVTSSPKTSTTPQPTIVTAYDIQKQNPVINEEKTFLSTGSPLVTKPAL